MTSKLVVNTIEADTGISSVSFASSISLSSTSVFHLGDAGFNIGADTNINRPAAGVIGFNINSSEKVRIDSSGHIKIVGVCTATHFYGNGSNLTSLPAANLTGALPAISGANLTGITQTTINNNADNRVITGSGTANTLNGESLVTVDSNGRMAIGLSVGGVCLTTSSAGSTYGGALKLRNTISSNHDWIIAVGGGDNAYVSGRGLLIRDETTGINHTQFRTTGDLVIGDGNLVVANGHGVDFNATANATAGQYNSVNPTTDSEVLHDYEFGSFTPHVRTQGGTSNATYSQKGGYYTKIGRMVYVTFFMNWSNATNHSGYIYFVGLPFFSGSNTATHLMYGIGTVQLNNFTISGNGGAVLHMGAATSGTNLASNNSGGISINEGHTNNGYIMANVTYIANY